MIHKVLSSPSPPLECPPLDLQNTFDNSQKVGRHSGRIRVGGHVPMSVCTTVGHIITYPESFLQFDDTPSPRVWLNKLTRLQVMQKIEEEEEIYIQEFRKYRGAFIEHAISKLVNEQQTNLNNTYYDYVDLILIFSE